MSIVGANFYDVDVESSASPLPSLTVLFELLWSKIVSEIFKSE